MTMRTEEVANVRTDLGTDMPEAERKKFAAKAVKDLMKTL